MKPSKEKLEKLFEDIGRLFGKLHHSNSDNEILTAARLMSKKMEAQGSHISELRNFLFPEGDDFMTSSPSSS